MTEQLKLSHTQRFLVWCEVNGLKDNEMIAHAFSRSVTGVMQYKYEHVKAPRGELIELIKHYIERQRRAGRLIKEIVAEIKAQPLWTWPMMEEWLTANNMTMGRLSKILKLSPSTVHKWRQNGRCPGTVWAVDEIQFRRPVQLKKAA